MITCNYNKHIHREKHKKIIDLGVMYINKFTFLTLFQKNNEYFVQKSKSFKLVFFFEAQGKVKVKAALMAFWGPLQHESS